MSVAPARTGQPLSPDSPIPNKLYFKIGEVSQLVGVRAHVLRYWEKEVSSIRPSKSASNQRRYRRKDVEVFREIRRLLYEERYTLAGAKKRLTAGGRDDEGPRPEPLGGPTDERGGLEATGDGSQLAIPGAIETGETAAETAEVAAELEPDGTRDELAHAPEEPELAPTESIPQLPLGFAPSADSEKIERVKAGLRELIRLAQDDTR
ncbi:MAG: MerR family transcriptional regulator [Myxococcota bacterium]